MNASRNRITSILVQIVSIALLPLALSACTGAAAETASARQTTTPPQDKSALIERLETAKQIDWKDSQDQSVALITRGDFLVQMDKANAAIEKLTNDYEVPRSQIQDALWIPPKSISTQVRERLIQQLHVARQHDDRNEQQMLNADSYDHMDFPANTAIFDLQKERATDVANDLKAGDVLPWGEIKSALYVPPLPSWA